MRVLSFILLFCLAPLSVAAPFTPEQEARIKALVRETMVSEPDILGQSLDAWQQKGSQDRIQSVLSSQKEALYHDDASPSMGAEKPLLTLVTFTDYNCPYCKRFDPELNRIVKNNPQVRLIIKLIPFRGESSITSAREALTVWRKDPQHFWALHQKLMAKKGYHDDASIRTAFQKSGAMAVEPDKQSEDTLRTNLKLAEALGVQGTPATLVGDTMLSGAVPREDLEALVKEQLAKARGG
jgi:protein-disulfide isomerase